MNLKKSVRCHIRMDSRWANASAVCMGLSIFLRTVYYFGLVNLKDLNGFEIAMQVILPMIVAAGYLLMIKALHINSPILFGGLVAVYAVNYILIMDGSAFAIAGAVLLLATAALFVGTGMGYIPSSLPLIAAGIATLLFRFIVVDLMGYILPLTEFHPIAYLPEASNLFGLAAIATMCPAVQLSPLRRGPESDGSAEPEAEDNAAATELEQILADIPVELSPELSEEVPVESASESECV